MSLIPFDGSFKWLTPEQITGATMIRFIVAPVDLLESFGGLLEIFSDPANWSESGVTIEETIDAIREIETMYYQPQFVGAIMPFVSTVFPPGFIGINSGATLARADYPELDAVAPPNWIDGQNIIIPPFQEKYLVGHVGAVGNRGASVGQNTYALTVGQLPEHSHSYTPPVFNVDLETPGAPDILAAGIGAPTQTGTAGSGNNIDNRPSSITIYYAIFTGRMT